MFMSKYDVILDTLPAKGDRIEILFREAGDGFIQVEYGQEQRVELLDSFRILAVDAKIKAANIYSLIETLPSLRANMIHFDPLKISPRQMIDKIKEIEETISGINTMVIDSRIITLPIAFEDSEMCIRDRPRSSSSPPGDRKKKRSRPWIWAPTTT